MAGIGTGVTTWEANDMSGARDPGYRDWLAAKAVAATFLRELLPDPFRTAEREDALTSALFARLATQDLLTVGVPRLERAEAAEALLKRLVEASDYGPGCEEFGGLCMGVAADARKLLEGK